jgi:hypothetical protein
MRSFTTCAVSCGPVAGVANPGDKGVGRCSLSQIARLVQRVLGIAGKRTCAFCSIWGRDLAAQNKTWRDAATPTFVVQLDMERR